MGHIAAAGLNISLSTAASYLRRQSLTPCVLPIPEASDRTPPIFFFFDLGRVHGPREGGGCGSGGEEESDDEKGVSEEWRVKSATA